MPDLPIACTLAPDALSARLALIESLSADGLLDRTATDAGVRIRLRDRPDIERRTRELITLESACCPFLDFDIGRAGGDLVLDVAPAVSAQRLLEREGVPTRHRYVRGQELYFEAADPAAHASLVVPW